MKKTILSLLACTSMAAAANAQGLLIYGSLEYNTNNVRDINNTQGANTYTRRTLNNRLSFNPGIGYMFNEHMAIGLQASAYGTKLHHDDDVPGSMDDNYRTSGVQVGPFIRFTKMMGENFYSFVQAEAGYTHGQTKTETQGSNYDPKDSYDGLRGNMFPSAGIKITPCMSLAINFGGVSYDYQKWDLDNGPNGQSGDQDNQKISNFNVNFGQQVNFTAQWILGGSHHRSGNMRPMDDTRRMDTDDDADDKNNSRRRRSNDDE